jgi:hypothetical protein
VEHAIAIFGARIAKRSSNRELCNKLDGTGSRIGGSDFDRYGAEVAINLALPTQRPPCLKENIQNVEAVGQLPAG